MRICVLTDEVPEDFNPAPYMEGFDWEMITMTDPVMDVLRSLDARNEFDVYINICEGYEPGEDWEYQGIDVVRALEEFNLPYTGANPAFFDPTREEMQAAADAHGVNFAKGYRVTNVEEAQRLVRNLRYPIMVKHPKSYGSTGMFRESRVDTPEQLVEQVERICSEFGAARMEEFIVGKEYNVLVVDNPDDLEHPIAYPPAELIFPMAKNSGIRISNGITTSPLISNRSPIRTWSPACMISPSVCIRPWMAWPTAAVTSA